jgi:hypothetical protein
VTAFDELYDRAVHSAQGATVFEGYEPDPEDLGGAERPIAGYIVQSDHGSIGVLLYMPHASGGSLTVHVQTFDTDGNPRHPYVHSAGHVTEVTVG